MYCVIRWMVLLPIALKKLVKHAQVCRNRGTQSLREETGSAEGMRGQQRMKGKRKVKDLRNIILYLLGQNTSFQIKGRAC